MFPHGGEEVRWGEVGAVDFNWFVYSLPFSRIGHCPTNIYILIQFFSSCLQIYVLRYASSWSSGYNGTGSGENGLTGDQLVVEP